MPWGSCPCPRCPRRRMCRLSSGKEVLKLAGGGGLGGQGSCRAVVAGATARPTFALLGTVPAPEIPSCIWGCRMGGSGGLWGRLAVPGAPERWVEAHHRSRNTPRMQGDGPDATFGQRGWRGGASHPGPALRERGPCTGHHTDCPLHPGACTEPLASIPSCPAGPGAVPALPPGTMARVSPWMSGNEAARHSQLRE